MAESQRADVLGRYRSVVTLLTICEILPVRFCCLTTPETQKKKTEIVRRTTSLQISSQRSGLCNPWKPGHERPCSRAGSSSTLSDMYIPPLRICWSCRSKASSIETRRRERGDSYQDPVVRHSHFSHFGFFPQHAIPPYWENHIALSMHRHSELANTDVGL